jgi:hypothetical protein
MYNGFMVDWSCKELFMNRSLAGNPALSAGKFPGFDLGYGPGLFRFQQGAQ